MVAHLGVVIIAVAFAASHSFSHQTQLTLSQGQTARFDGHSFSYLGMKTISASTHSAVAALVRVDGGKVYGPAISDYPFASEEIGTPSVRSRAAEDVYLTLAATPAKPGGPVVIGVIVEPLVTWIWVGGGVIIAGSVLAAWPGRRRRRPTDAVGAPVTGDEPVRSQHDVVPERQPVTLRLDGRA